MLPWEDRSEGAGTPQIPKFPPVSPPVYMVNLTFVLTHFILDTGKQVSLQKEKTQIISRIGRRFCQ